MTEVIVPFDKVATWWHENGNKGIMLTHEVVDWIRQYPGLRVHREWLMGPDKSKWKVLLEFNQSGPATLFKLTFGGQ